MLGVAGFRLREKLTIRPAMAPMPPPMAWPNNNLEVAYRMTSGIWTTAGICAPCGRPPGDVYHDSIGGTRNEATDAPSRVPASMRMSAVFTIQISITRRGVFTAQSRALVENAECDVTRARGIDRQREGLSRGVMAVAVVDPFHCRQTRVQYHGNANGEWNRHSPSRVRSKAPIHRR